MQAQGINFHNVTAGRTCRYLRHHQASSVRQVSRRKWQSCPKGSLTKNVQFSIVASIGWRMLAQPVTVRRAPLCQPGAAYMHCDPRISPGHSVVLDFPGHGGGISHSRNSINGRSLWSSPCSIILLSIVHGNHPSSLYQPWQSLPRVVTRTI